MAEQGEQRLALKARGAVFIGPTAVADPCAIAKVEGSYLKAGAQAKQQQPCPTAVAVQRLAQSIGSHA